MKTIKRIPKFKSEAQEARFWKTHQITDYLGELKEVRNIKFPKPRKRLVSVRMEDDLIKSLKQIAATKGIGYLTLMRMWIIERLTREHKFIHA